MRGSFLIISKDEKIITEKGLRAFVMEKLLNSSFSKGAVISVGEKTVEVRLEGDEKHIKEFKKELEKELLYKFGNPVIIFTEFKEDILLEIPKIMRASQALLVGQLSKGIGVQLQILDVLEKLPERIAKAIKEN